MDYKIIHSLDKWLPLTENWIFNQIKCLTDFDQLIVANERLSNSPDWPVVVKKEWESGVVKKAREFLSRKLNGKEYFRTKLLEENEPYILFSHMGPRGYHDLPYSKGRHVVRFYGFDIIRLPKINPAWKERYEKLFKSCSMALVEGPHMAKILTTIGCPEEKIKVIPIGVYVNEVDFEKREQEGQLQALIASSFREKKGIIYSIEAIGELIMEGYDIFLHIVGDITSNYERDINYKKEILSLVEQYNLGKRVRFYGFIPQPEVFKLAYKCQIALHPSVWAEDGDCEGGYPVIIPELMATGLPLITTDHCDIPFVVNNNNGFICKEHDVEDIKQALVKIIKNKNILPEKSLAARETIETRFDWKNICPRMTSFFKALGNDD